MEFYIPNSRDGFQLIHPCDETDFDVFHSQLNGVPRLATWKPISVKLLKVETHDDKLLEPTDSPSMVTSDLFFTAHAARKLGPILGSYGEFLPLECSDVELFAYNATNIIDALDEKRSDIWRYRDGRIMRIAKYVLSSAAVMEVDVFRIPQWNATTTFFSQNVVELWESSGLVGLEFKAVQVV
jgi:hypothetical protein